VKLIKDKVKNTPVGYGFVEFPNYEIAKNVYINLNNTSIPGT
jgi:RNA recognition motif-containing protein